MLKANLVFFYGLLHKIMKTIMVANRSDLNFKITERNIKLLKSGLRKCDQVVYHLLGKTGWSTVGVNGTRQILNGNFQGDALIPFPELFSGENSALLLLFLLSSQSLLVFFMCVSRVQTMHLGHQSPKSIFLFRY